MTEGTPAAAPVIEPVASPPAPSPVATPPAAVMPPSPAPAPDKTFTQAELDAIVQDRLKREKDKYQGYDDLKKAAAELKAIKDAQLTDQEKKDKAMDELNAKLSESEAKRLEAEADAATERRVRRVVGIALTLGAIDPQDANILAATVTIDPNSAKVDEEIKAALEALKAGKPYLFKVAGNVRLEGFNPASGPLGPESDKQRVERLYRSRGTGKTPFG